MKIVFCLLMVVGATYCEYPRMPYRPQLHYPKPPPYHQISKKYPPRVPIRHTPPLRPPPIPVRMPSHHTVAASIKRPVAVPYWKHQPTTYRPPAVTSPPVLPPSFATIKQIGEMGPIHTIPAPNLGPADKPVISQPEVEVQKTHQYQVTEIPEHNLLKTYYEPANQNDLYHLLQTPEFLQIIPSQNQNFVQEQYAMDKSSHIDEIENKKESNSFVTATYSLEPEVSQSQFIQTYFEPTTNNSAPYVVLPNKETAEKLATLQQAGKINSKLQNGEMEARDSDQFDEDNDYDYDLEDSDGGYGHKISTNN